MIKHSFGEKILGIVVAFGITAALIFLWLQVVACGQDTEAEVPLTQCESVCMVAQVWGDSCGYPELDIDGCVEGLAYSGITEWVCERARECYVDMRLAGLCHDPSGLTDEWWRVSLFQMGCPVK